MNHPMWVPEAAFDAPRSGDPIFPADQAPSPEDPIPLFGDDAWSLRFFSANPSSSLAKIYWTSFPPASTEHLRLAGWAMLNLPLPADALLGQKMRSQLSAPVMYQVVLEWRRLSEWLMGQGVTCLTDLGPELMGEYAEHLRRNRRQARATAFKNLTAITRLWLIGQQIPSLALSGAPPWVTGDVDDYLPPKQSTQMENSTAPIAPDVISALLWWAMHIVRTCEAAALEAHEFRLALLNTATGSPTTGATKAGQAAIRNWFEKLKDRGDPLPVRFTRNNVEIANGYISLMTGVPLGDCTRLSTFPEVRAYMAVNTREASFTFTEPPATDFVPATLPIDQLGRFSETYETACFIVIAYLTGMRTGEVLGLETGDLQPSDQPGEWMVLRSRTFKTATDEFGNHDSAGVRRSAPWVAVAPVAAAFSGIARTRPEGGLLFPTHRPRRGVPRSKHPKTIRVQVRRFISLVNEFQPGAIPVDPGGEIAPSRFRRTLAWHIANQPGGLVALAVQYGHLRTAVTEGYASRTGDGIRDLLDVETARSVALRLSEVHDQLREGERVSGPSAVQFVDALRRQKEQYGGVVASTRQARHLLQDPALNIYRNDEAFVWCNFKSETAKCLTSQETVAKSEPHLDACNSTCSNIARTDSMAQDMRRKADRLDREAQIVPDPIAIRLGRNAARLRELANTHDTTSIIGALDDE